MKIVFHLILIFLITGLEKTGLSGKLFLNPTLCFIIFFTLYERKNFIFLWPILGGTILDFFSIFKFPIFTISFLVTFLIIRFIGEKILVSRTFVSFVSFSAGGIFLYNLIFLILNGIIYFLKIGDFFITFNFKYFLYFLSNTIFTLFLLVIFKKRYEQPILYS